MLAPVRPPLMARQVRLADDVCEWLEVQGGSLSAAAERTLRWAIDVIEADAQAVDNYPDSDPEPVDSHLRPPAGDSPRVRTSVRSARNARAFAAIVRRSY